ncbi:hypothetical protein PGIGA_G00213150 [Pangasianodon gigas]|uniref:Uncharacterized protein n=1 Tax=Pangasianodon gigas TaxID=30993 RepID=A0ACC5WH58_PANGG|nr:hypothetical protein [Pangasianodon gigas]
MLQYNCLFLISIYTVRGSLWTSYSSSLHDSWVWAVCSKGSCPSERRSVDSIVSCSSTRGPVHKGRLAGSLDLKSSHHSPSIHICSLRRQGLMVRLGEQDMSSSLCPSGREEQPTE